MQFRNTEIGPTLEKAIRCTLEICPTILNEQEVANSLKLTQGKLASGSLQVVCFPFIKILQASFTHDFLPRNPSLNPSNMTSKLSELPACLFLSNTVSPVV